MTYSNLNHGTLDESIHQQPVSHLMNQGQRSAKGMNRHPVSASFPEGRFVLRPLRARMCWLLLVPAYSLCRPPQRGWSDAHTHTHTHTRAREREICDAIHLGLSATLCKPHLSPFPFSEQHDITLPSSCNTAPPASISFSPIPCHAMRTSPQDRK